MEKPLLLLVDDQQFDLDMLSVALSRHFRIETTLDGVAALEIAARQDKPDLILLDMIMPGMNGVEVLRRLREHPDTADIAVILITADTTQQSQADSLDLGVDDYLLKPFFNTVLLARVNSVLKRKQAERELRLLSQVFNCSAEPIVITDSRNRLIRINPAFTKMSGYTLEEVQGKHPKMLSFGRTTDEQSREIRRCIDEEGLWQGEVWNRRYDGSEFPALLNISVVKDTQGEVQSFIGSYNDLSSQKAVEDEIRQVADRLRESEERTRTILNTAVDGIVTINQEKAIISVNPAVERIFGYSQQELLGENVSLLMPEPYHSEHDSYVDKYLSSGVSHIIGLGREVLGRRKDGSVFPMELAVSETAVCGQRLFTGVLRDISERKLMDDALRTARMRLEMAMDMSQLVKWEYEVAADRFLFDDRFYALYGTSVEREGARMSAEQYARQFLPPSDVGLVAEAIAKAMASPGEYAGQLEHRIVRRDGEERIIAVRFMVARDDEGNIVRMYGANQDITTQKRVEEKLTNAYDLIRTDLEAAASIQKNLLPEPLALEGVRFEWLFCPSSYVAGDIFNYFYIDQGKLGFYLLDVSGHGVPAAMLSVSMSWMFSNMLQNEGGDGSTLSRTQVMSPARVLGRLNNIFQEARTAGQYITMIYGVVDCNNDRLTLSQAGLPAPVYCSRSGRSETVGSGGFPVGLIPDATYEEETIDFYPGDRLFLYSDGITECFNEELQQFSDERLVALTEKGAGQRLDHLLTGIESELRIWRGDKPFDDDVTLLAIERQLKNPAA
jgi:PAS domain S-box-containing protein